jgi:hypothetical protein
MQVSLLIEISVSHPAWQGDAASAATKMHIEEVLLVKCLVA